MTFLTFLTCVIPVIRYGDSGSIEWTGTIERRGSIKPKGSINGWGVSNGWGLLNEQGVSNGGGVSNSWGVSIGRGVLNRWDGRTDSEYQTCYQCCGSKYIEFGSGSRILAQFGSGSRAILSILKEKIQNSFIEK